MIKIVFIFFIVVLHNDNTIKLTSNIVSECPNKQEFIQAMNTKFFAKEIQFWEASCFQARMLYREKGVEL